MEEEKLLCSLISVIFLGLVSTTANLKCYANDESAAGPEFHLQPTNTDIGFASKLLERTRAEALKEIVTKYKELEAFSSNEKIADTGSPDHENEDLSLRVFVSQSMPLEALKHYYREAAKYSGTLVFKGLPNGSFKEIMKLVTQIEQNIGEASIIIDDEEFSRFEVQNVPVIILSKQCNYLSKQPCTPVFDKVAGNIGITHGLELFALEGDLSEAAQNILAK